MKSIFVFVAIGLLSAVGLQAEVINLFNSGVDNSGVVLTAGTTPDPHYTLISTPAGPGSAVTVLTSAGGFPIPPWLDDSSLSAWISPANSPGNGPPGNYDYRTTFNTNGTNLADILLKGRWATDNSGVDILINGVSTGATIPYGFGAFESWTDFTIGSGFVDGDNTIDFIVNNASNSDNPTGLRVEIAQVPEPGSVALFGIGMTALGVLGRKRFTQE